MHYNIKLLSTDLLIMKSGMRRGSRACYFRWAVVRLSRLPVRRRHVFGAHRAEDESVKPLAESQGADQPLAHQLPPSAPAGIAVPQLPHSQGTGQLHRHRLLLPVPLETRWGEKQGRVLRNWTATAHCGNISVLLSGTSDFLLTNCLCGYWYDMKAGYLLTKRPMHILFVV